MAVGISVMLGKDGWHSKVCMVCKGVRLSSCCGADPPDFSGEKTTTFLGLVFSLNKTKGLHWSVLISLQVSNAMIPGQPLPTVIALIKKF